MKAETSLTPEKAKAIADVISTVMEQLRALRDVADRSIASDDNSTLAIPSLTVAICERAHVLLDECSFRLGGTSSGAYDVADLFKASREGEETEAETT